MRIIRSQLREQLCTCRKTEIQACIIHSMYRAVTSLCRSPCCSTPLFYIFIISYIHLADVYQQTYNFSTMCETRSGEVLQCV